MPGCLQDAAVPVQQAEADGVDFYEADWNLPCAIVLGGEDSGVSRLVREKCDGVLSLPMKGSINSLNASVACAIVIYEITRQRSGIHAYNQ